MRKPPIFGEWLINPARGRALRLVIEQMSEASSAPSAAKAVLITVPGGEARVSFSSGSGGWPWKGAGSDPSPAITWTCPGKVDFTSLKIDQTSDREWIRRYRIEVSEDGRRWRSVVPSRIIDSYHRQPCRLKNNLTLLESSLLQSASGTGWANTLMEDFMFRALEKLGPDSAYPDWLSGDYFLSGAARPFFFGGVYNAGDVGNFDALIGAILSPEMAIETQKLFPDIIGRFGFMPGVMNSGKDDEAFLRDYSSTTWGPCGYWDIFAWTRDRQYLCWFADACAKWADWWKSNRDRNHDGWLEPGVNACLPASEELRAAGAKAFPQIAARCPEFWDYTGAHKNTSTWPAQLLAIYEEPWDDSGNWVMGRHIGLKFDPKTCSLNIRFIETQLYISMLNQFVADAYTRLGRSDQAKPYAAEANRLMKLVADNCWDEKTGFYYDCDENGQRRTFVKHLGAFLPMMMGLPTPEQAARMVKRLMDPAQFWSNYPFPVISKDSPDYDPNGYWTGRAWPPTNYFVLRALLNYGYFDEADRFLKRWIAQTQFCMDGKMGPDGQRAENAPDVKIIVPENWNPDTGFVAGSGGLTWGGLWLPAVIIRNFWPVGEHSAILRPGGSLHLVWGDRWKVEISSDRATVNGHSYKLSEKKSYLLDERTWKIRALEPGKADPVVLSRLNAGAEL